MLLPFLLQKASRYAGGVMKTYEAVIFDLDGTLLDTLEDLANSVNWALSRQGVPHRTLEEVRSFVGNGVRNLMIRALPGGESHPYFEEAFADFRSHYAEHCRDNTRPYPHIMDVVHLLAEKGCRLAVVSNKSDAEVRQLCKEHFGGVIPLAVGERPGIRRKPEPDSVLATLEQMGVSRAGAVYVGDSEVDVATARNAGVACIAVTWGFRSFAELRAAGAEILIDDPLELVSLV